MKRLGEVTDVPHQCQQELSLSDDFISDCVAYFIVPAVHLGVT